MLSPSFDLQGHRGARGLKPENTFPGFEAALDLGVSSVETDVQLTADGVAVLYHDVLLGESLCRPLPSRPVPDLARRPPLASTSLAQLRGCRADRNPDPARFPGQDAGVTPLAELFAGERGIDPFTPPTLAELFAFTDAYANEAGRRVGKTDDQRRRARGLRFDLELKSVPFRPALSAPAGALEHTVAEEVRRAGVADRTNVRSFDHRCLQVFGRLLPGVPTAVLVAHTAPVAPGELAGRAGAQVYCPDADFFDLDQLRALHALRVRVIPWTVNDPADWRRLLDWGVDGITTDFPDGLAALLRARGVPF